MTKTASTRRDTYHVGNLAPLLLTAARSMLAEVGPSKLSLRAVSERVGVSSTATYYHYSNRNELLGQLGAQGFLELRQALCSRPVGKSAADLLYMGCRAYFSFAKANPALYQLMFGSEIHPQDMIATMSKARDEAFDELKRIISEVLGKPIDSVEVRTTALSSWALSHGLASLVIHGVLPDVNDKLVDRALLGFAHLVDVGAIAPCN